MSTEILAVPEDHLEEVIEIIRTGLKWKTIITPEVRENLEKWCKEEEEYLDELKKE